MVTKYLYTPNVYSEMDSLVDYFLRDFISDNSKFSTDNKKWLVKGDVMPRLDIYQEDDKFIVEAAIAGISKDDVKIEIENNVLMFSYEKIKDAEEREKKYFYKETSSSSFKKYVALPQSIDVENVKTTYNNGVIKVIFGIEEKAKKKTLLIE